MRMSHRCLVAVVIGIAVGAVTSTGAVAQSADPTTPRTPWGAPDLQGVWDFRSITPMERPEEQADKEFLTEEEAASLEQETIDRNERLLNRSARRTQVTESVDSGEDGAPGFYNNFWLDRGTTPVGTSRTSLVVDPPNGRVPGLTAEAQAKQAALAEAREGVTTHEPTPGGWVEDLGANGLQVRCITGFNSGPPMTPGGYNNNVQLFQTADHVVLLNEMNHNVRIVPLDGRPHVDLAVGGGFPRPLGRRHARDRDEELPARDELHARELEPGLASGRAVYPSVSGDAVVPGDGRRSDDLDETVDLRSADDEELGAALRVCVSRGKLRASQHPRWARHRGPTGRGRHAAGFAVEGHHVSVALRTVHDYPRVD